MNTPTLLTIAAVHTAAVMAPGSNFLVVTRNALGYSRQVGLYTAVGVAGGSLCFITTGLLGVTAVLTRLPWLTSLIQLLGGLFLLYMGYRVCTTRSASGSGADPSNTIALTNQQAFFTGLLTSLSNPNSALYFLAMFTTTLSAATSVSFRVTTAVLMGSISFSWYTLVAFSFSKPAVQSFYGRIERWGNTVLGILLIVLALKLLLALRPS